MDQLTYDNMVPVIEDSNEIVESISQYLDVHAYQHATDYANTFIEDDNLKTNFVEWMIDKAAMTVGCEEDYSVHLFNMVMENDAWLKSTYKIAEEYYRAVMIWA